MNIPESKQLKKDNRIIVASYNISAFENKIYNYILREIQIKINTTKNELNSMGLAEDAIEKNISNTILICEISKFEIANLKMNL